MHMRTGPYHKEKKIIFREMVHGKRFNKDKEDKRHPDLSVN